MNSVFDMLLDVVNLLTFQFQTAPNPHWKPSASEIAEETSEPRVDEPDEQDSGELSAI